MCLAASSAPGSSVTRHWLNFSHVDRRGDALAVVDQRLARKQAGGVGVRPHAAMHHVEVRQLAVVQAEELADLSA